MRVTKCACSEPTHALMVDADEFGVCLFVGAHKGSLWDRIKFAFRHVFKQDMVFSDMIMDQPHVVDSFIKDIEDAKAKMLADRENFGGEFVDLNDGDVL